MVNADYWETLKAQSLSKDTRPGPCSCFLALLLDALSWTQSWFLEVFSGEALAAMAASMPVLHPWDIKFNLRFDVVSQGHILLRLAQWGKIAAAHFAIPCQSLSWARAPQLRSANFPYRVPNLLPHQADLVALGNCLLEFTASMCATLMEQGCYFSVENPELSWLWVLPPFAKLRDHDGVSLTRLVFSDFGAPFSKPTLFLHNTPRCVRMAGAYHSPSRCGRVAG